MDSEKVEAWREEILKHSVYDKEHIAEQYDGLAETFDHVFDAVGYPDPAMYPKVFESMNIPKDAEIHVMDSAHIFIYYLITRVN